MSGLLKDLEARMQMVEANQGKVQELIDLLNDVKSALRIFVKVGNGIKWLAVLVATVSGGIMAARKWM
jgi:prefoldin subunit 5